MNPRQTLDKHIKELYDEIVVLGSMVEQAVINAVEALHERDYDLARKTYEADKLINEKRFEIENDVMVTIATQQPVARDVRILASVFEIAAELERMGDYAKGIARIHMMTAEDPPLKDKRIRAIPEMAGMTVDMLNRAVKAFVETDVEAAYTIPKADDEIDKLYQKLLKQLIKEMNKDNDLIEQANFFIWAGHNLERMADRVTNICERTIYIATGENIEIDKTDDEMDGLD